jgi:hypothetical protein
MEAPATLYCLPFSDICRPMMDWKDFALMSGAIVGVIGTVAGIPAAIFAAYKTFQEQKKNRIHREEDLKLRRAEFTLTQHRRLFDDATLHSVLALVDSDDLSLANPQMWDPKRKFLTFFEELCLLINSELVSKDVALYMFGYYALAANEGPNFRTGISWDERYWGLFSAFANDAKKFLEDSEQNQSQKLSNMKL